MKKARLIVGAAEKSSDLRYATHLRTPDDFVYFECGVEKIAVLSALEHDRGVNSIKSGVRVVPADACGNGGIADQIRHIASQYGIGCFEVPSDFPLRLADTLRGGGLKITAADGAFFPEREFKTAAEAAAVEEAMRVTENGMRRAVEILAETSVGNGGVLKWRGEELTSETLRREIDLELLRGGGFSDATIVAGGRQGAEPHNQGSGVLLANTPIVIDIFPKMLDSSYCGDLTRTLCKGRFAPEVKSAWNAVTAARDAAKAAIRPGAIPAEIHAGAARMLEEAGFATLSANGVYRGFFHGLGHGVGLDIHEAPRLSTGNRRPFQGGEIVTVEPGLYYPEWGGVRMEDIVLVTEGGCRCLTRIEDFGEIA